MFNENGNFCTSLTPNTQGSMLDSASQTSIYRDLDENNIITSFSMDDLSNNPNLNNPQQADEAGSMAGLESLDQQIDINGNINPNAHVNIESATWDTTWQQNKQNHQHLLDDYSGMQYQNVPFTNTQFTVAPDLLNLMHLTPPQGLTSGLRPSDYPLEMCNEIQGVAIGETETGLSGLTYNPNQSHLLRDLFHSLPKNGIFASEDEREAMMGIGGDIFQEMNEMQFENAILERKRELGRGRGKGNFATERQRREQLNEKYKALKSLFPNPTKSDRASIVGDAIEYINELDRTIKELRILLDKKKHRIKRAKTEDDSGADMGESSTLGPTTMDQDQSMNGSLRSSWLQRRSKESLVDVRIVDEEVNIRVTQKKRAHSLLYASKALDELQLELMHVSGGNIGDHHIFMFNTKICEGASVYASTVAKKLLDSMDKLGF